MSEFDPVGEATYFGSIWKLSNFQIKELEDAFMRAKLSSSPDDPTMWATVVQSEYDDVSRWVCRSMDDMGDGDVLPVITMAADTFPVGTTLEIREPTSVASFECEDCIGMGDHGCYCAAMGATEPGGAS